MMQPLKIGFLLGSLNGAGAEKTILTLSQAIAEKGHAVDLYLLNAEGDYAHPDNITIIEVPGNNNAEKSAALQQMTGQGQYDLFVSTRGEFYDCVSAANKFCSVHITPTAWIKHPKWQFWKTPKKLKNLRNKFRNKRLIALSEGIRRDLIDNLGCHSQDITVINNPFETREILAKAAEETRVPDYPYIIYVASLIDRKRHADLLRAFAKLNNRDIRLLLLGKGPLEDELKQLAAKLGVAERVIFWGWDINPYRLIKQARVSILASEAEGLPRVVIESLLLQTPVVSTDCPSGPNEVLVGELAPFLVPVGDINAMATAIDRALVQYPEINLQALQRFDAAAVAQRYLDLV